MYMVYANPRKCTFLSFFFSARILCITPPPSPHPLCSHNPPLPPLGNSVLNALEKCMGYAKEIIVLRCPNTPVCRSISA